MNTKSHAGVLFVILLGMAFPAKSLGAYIPDYSGTKDGYHSSEAVGHYYYDSSLEMNVYIGYTRTYWSGSDAESIPQCSAGVDVELGDSPNNATVVSRIPTTSRDNESIWTYYWDNDEEDSTANYNFTWNVRAQAHADVQLLMRNLNAYGKIEAHGYVKLIGETATTEKDEDEGSVWVGADFLANAGGLTGLGFGEYSFSIEWELPDWELLAPSTARDEIVLIHGTDDDPGSQCFVHCVVRAEVQSTAFNRLWDTRYEKTFANGSGAIHTYYPNLILGPPVRVR